MTDLHLHLDWLRQAYSDGTTTPTKVVDQVYSRIEKDGLRPIWISLIEQPAAMAIAKRLEASADLRKLPLYGVPFAVKDNIDIAGIPTTAACPAFRRVPDGTAFVVQQLESAGAILIGKTNMDQFATGLVGTRTPYGICSSVFHPEYISGGSSSGSAVAVAKGLVSFALGTDTAGSGRIPAAFNNIVGVKPTRGLLSTTGVLPACRTLDCVSIFALSSRDASVVLDAVARFDVNDPFSRALQPGDGASPWITGSFTFGVPADDQLEFFGDIEAPHLFRYACDALERLGGAQVQIDFAPFRAAADLLYAGPWVAERFAAIEDFIKEHESEMHPVVRQIITGSRRFTAVDTFKANYRLAELRRQTDDTWRKIDLLMLPTAPRTYKLAEVEAEPISLNTNLGYYTNFVNLLDLAAVAVPAGIRSDRLPFGASLIGPAFSDRALLAVAGRLHRLLAHTPPNLQDTDPSGCPPGCVLIAVVGAHLTGQPLNWQLTVRRGRIVATTKTDPAYRLFALRNTSPPKPGLLCEPGFAGPGIEVEIWALPEDTLGSFIDQVPSPLGIGKLRLIDGTVVNGFICEPAALSDADEITHFGGWRNYLGSL